MDDFVEKEQIIPDVIKIDVEQHERFVLEGAWKTIEKFRPTIIIEANNQLLIENFESIFSKLKGYEVSPVGSQQFYPLEHWPQLAKDFQAKEIIMYDYVLKPLNKFTF
jgi:hypothetical protein